VRRRCSTCRERCTSMAARNRHRRRRRLSATSGGHVITAARKGLSTYSLDCSSDDLRSLRVMVPPSHCVSVLSRSSRDGHSDTSTSNALSDHEEQRRRAGISKRASSGGISGNAATVASSSGPPRIAVGGRTTVHKSGPRRAQLDIAQWRSHRRHGARRCPRQCTEPRSLDAPSWNPLVGGPNAWGNITALHLSGPIRVDSVSIGGDTVLVGIAGGHVEVAGI
jgi:hypothetical protein